MLKMRKVSKKVLMDLSARLVHPQNSYNWRSVQNGKDSRREHVRYQSAQVFLLHRLKNMRSHRGVSSGEFGFQALFASPVSFLASTSSFAPLNSLAHLSGLLPEKLQVLHSLFINYYKLQKGWKFETCTETQPLSSI